MDQRERIPSFVETIRAYGEALSAGLYVAMPGIVQSWSATDLTCSVQPAIKGMQQQEPGNAFQAVQLPVLVKCPVKYPSGGGFMFTFPLAAGDEGIILIADRCIDGWWQQSGIQPPLEYRLHDLSDGFFLPGVFSVPKVPTALVSATNARWGLKTGTAYIELTPGGAINLVAPAGITANGVAIDSAQAITNAANIALQSGVELAGHVHGGVASGSDETGPPSG